MTDIKPVVVLDASIPRDPAARVAELRIMVALMLPDARGSTWTDTWHAVLHAAPATLSFESVVGHDAAMAALYKESLLPF